MVFPLKVNTPEAVFRAGCSSFGSESVSRSWPRHRDNRFTAGRYPLREIPREKDISYLTHRRPGPMTRRNAQHPPAGQRFHPVPDRIRSAVVRKAPGKTGYRTGRLVIGPGNGAPASGIPGPASNEASTRRPEKGAKPNKSPLRHAGTGERLRPGATLCQQNYFPGSGAPVHLMVRDIRANPDRLRKRSCSRCCGLS